MNLNPLTQINLFEHKEIFNQLYKLSKSDTLPNKILLSGEKGIGKSTLAYHLINLVLSENEEHQYDFENNKINPDNKSYKLILNKSNPNFYLIDVLEEKKNIDIGKKKTVSLNEVLLNYSTSKDFGIPFTFTQEEFNKFKLTTIKNVMQNGKNIGYLAISENANDIKAAINERKTFVIRTALAIGLVILIFSIVLNRYFLKPIKNLVTYTETIRIRY